MTELDQFFSQLSGGRLLDVATGSGGFVRFLVDNLADYTEIVGIDVLENGAAAFEGQFGENPKIRFILMDAEKMDFPDASFDTVCIANSLHHMSSLESVLLEMKRILKPGGNFIVLEMYQDGQTEAQLTHVQLHHWWAAVDTALGISHSETYTRKQVLDILGELDLQEIACLDYRDLATDPLDPQLIQQLEQVFDRYQARCEGLPDQESLQKRGEELRQRVHQIGFQSATSLVYAGRK
jgi:ubiquinone/menaquinone biosynthesis C-methylase UbiE